MPKVDTYVGKSNPKVVNSVVKLKQEGPKVGKRKVSKPNTLSPKVVSKMVKPTSNRLIIGKLRARHPSL